MQNDIKKWIKNERIKIKHYLIQQGIEKPNIGESPAFEVYPYFAIWAIESVIEAGKIGWWAFSGDCPTDYVSEDGNCHPRNALKILLIKWKEYVIDLKSNKMPMNIEIGSANNCTDLGELLEKRILVLEEYVNDDTIWEER